MSSNMNEEAAVSKRLCEASDGDSGYHSLTQVCWKIRALGLLNAGRCYECFVLDQRKHSRSESQHAERLEATILHGLLLL